MHVRRLSIAWEASFYLQVPPEREDSSRALLDAIVADSSNFSATLLNELLPLADNATQLQQTYTFMAVNEPPPASALTSLIGEVERGGSIIGGSALCWQ